MIDFRPLSKRFDDQSSPAQKEADWLELDARMSARAAAKHKPMHASRIAPAALAAAVTLAAAAAALLALQPSRPSQMPFATTLKAQPGPLHVEGGETVQSQVFTSSFVRSVTLDDGSELQQQSPANVRLQSNDGAHFELAQGSGAVHYKVTPGGPRRWSIDAALAHVEVVGTEFTVSVSDAQLTVNVDHGIVRVTGDAVPDHERLLTTGESLVVRAPSPAAAQQPASLAQNATLPTHKNMHNAPTLGATTDEAERAKHNAAVVLRARADELWALADASRREGRAREAVPALERLVQMHPEDARAPLAAFTLGRIYQDTMHTAPDALCAFDKALSLGLPSNLREDALFHRAELLCVEPDSPACSAAQHAVVSAFPDAQTRLKSLGAP